MTVNESIFTLLQIEKKNQVEKKNQLGNKSNKENGLKLPPAPLLQLSQNNLTQTLITIVSKHDIFLPHSHISIPIAIVMCMSLENTNAIICIIKRKT